MAIDADMTRRLTNTARTCASEAYELAPPPAKRYLDDALDALDDALMKLDELERQTSA